MKSSLAIKFNVVFLVVFVVGFIASSLFANSLLQNSAREQSLDQARMLMGTAAASSRYTSEQIVPLLENRLKFEFLPQSIPSFAATEQLQQLLKAYPDFLYKEATLNPTNPRNKATGWETEVVNQLRDQPQTKELIGERSDGSGPALFVAQPIQITDPACLACHTSPETAPKTVVDLYGPHNGFGWKLDEIIGARLVSVPLAVPLQRASELLHTFMLSLLGVFVFLFCALNIMVHLFVTRRLKTMTDIANRVSLGEDDVPDMDLDGHDELARLGQSFARMRTSLVSAMKMLEA
ncbi:c-type heme family protein [Pseudomonas sp. NPDC089554]|uniref:c-type heme family protein n=1 Tax=Pseudomonas sp. NPDC089554 TaxID=3390653 RepID=UPI003D0701AA